MSRTALRLSEDVERSETPALVGHSISSRTSIAIVCGVPTGLAPSSLQEWLRAVNLSHCSVTWAVSYIDLETIGRILGQRFGERSIALRLPEDCDALAIHPSRVRRALEKARCVLPTFDSIVIESDAATSFEWNGGMLVEQGIRAVCSNMPLIAASRSSRRPPPQGWACRSPVWGLWEFRLGTSFRSSLMSRLTGLANGPRVPAGSLTVLSSGDMATGRKHGPAFPEDLRERHALRSFETVIRWANRISSRGRASPIVATLSDLSAELSHGTTSGGYRRLAA